MCDLSGADHRSVGADVTGDDASRARGTCAGYPDRAEAAMDRGLRLSRRTHAFVYDAGAAAWLLGAAAHNRFMEALLAAVSNGGNQHEL